MTHCFYFLCQLFFDFFFLFKSTDSTVLHFALEIVELIQSDEPSKFGISLEKQKLSMATMTCIFLSNLEVE